MASLLYVCVRPETGAADAEHASFRRALGVDVVDRLDLLHEPLTPAHLDRYRGVVIGGSPFNVTDAEKTAVQRRVEADLETLARARSSGSPRSSPASASACSPASSAARS